MFTLKINRGNGESIIAFDGTPALTKLLKQNGLTIATPCGGKGICGKCKVTAGGALSALTTRERESLSPAEIADGTRLACQVTLLGNAVITVHDTSDFMNIQLEGTLPEFPQQPMEGHFGLAVDVGTTTLALRLINLDNRVLLSAQTAANPQATVAADVIGRMEAAMNGEGHTLQTLVTQTIETALHTLCENNAISPGDIGPVVIAGNTTMLYLLSGRNPLSLSRAPFEADCLFGHWTDGAALGLRSLSKARVYLPACVSAFVGADIVCGVLASGLCERAETSLLVDLGTNGEIALWHEGTLYCCATAAGPAFEGVNISHGTGSIPGAIDSVWVRSGRLAYTTIGGQTPVGICGSGLIDATAALLAIGRIDETGLMDTGEELIGGPVSLTQKDIRSVQLAKGAIAAGIQTLCQHVGIREERIERLYIAGGFGSHVSIVNAAAIGLIPKALTDRAAVLGNASLTGTVMLLLNQTYPQAAAAIAKNAVSVPLGGSAAFADAYMECMLFEQ